MRLLLALMVLGLVGVVVLAVLLIAVTTAQTEPEAAELEARAGEAADRWADRNAGWIATLVAEAILASPAAESTVPSLEKVVPKSSLMSGVSDDRWGPIDLSRTEVRYRQHNQFVVTLLVAGKMTSGGAVIEGIDLSVPILVTVALDTEEVLDSRVDSDQVAVTVRWGDAILREREK